MHPLPLRPPSFFAGAANQSSRATTAAFAGSDTYAGVIICTPYALSRDHTQPALAVVLAVIVALFLFFSQPLTNVISTEGGVFCRRSGEIPVFRLCSCPCCCRCFCCCSCCRCRFTSSFCAHRRIPAFPKVA